MIDIRTTVLRDKVTPPLCTLYYREVLVQIIKLSSRIRVCSAYEIYKILLSLNLFIYKIIVIKKE